MGHAIKPVIKIEARDVFKAFVYSVPVLLADGQRSTIHVVKQERAAVRPRVVVFAKPTVLLDYCLEKGIENGVVGGFDLHHSDTLLGDIWTEGLQHPSEPIAAPWNLVRGCMYVDTAGDLEVGARGQFPRQPKGDLLQTGPVLVKEGLSLMVPGVSPEGFSDTAHQFTPDPSVGRHPRAAIGYDDDYIWTVVCDGRQPGEAGLDLCEMADVMITIGTKHALNLDGGSSTQLVRRGRLLNNPYGQYGDHYPEGYPISTAIVFEPR